MLIFSPGELRRRLRAYLFHGGTLFPGSLPWYAEWLRFLVLVRRVFWRNGLFARSGAMAFISLFSVFPLAAVLMSLVPFLFRSTPVPQVPRPDWRELRTALPAPVARVFAGSDETSGMRDDSVTSASGLRAAADGTSVPTYADEVRNFMFEAFAPVESSEGWRQNLQQLLDEFRERSAAAGALGIIALILGALAFYTTAQEAFNDIWKAQRQRGRVQTIVVFSGVLLWLPLVIFLSIYLGHLLLSINATAAALYALSGPALFTLVFFTAVYRYVPTVDVRLQSAFFGGLVATVLWMLAKSTFAAYLSHARNLSNLLQTVGVIPYFIMWMYISWVVLLLGAVVSYTVQNYRSLVVLETGGSVPVLDPVLALLILSVIGRSFCGGRGGVDYRELLRLFPVSPLALNEHLAQLESHGYIAQLSEGEKYVLARPPDSILLTELFGTARRAHHLLPSDHELMSILGRFDNASGELLAGHSLGALLAEARPLPEGEPGA